MKNQSKTIQQSHLQTIPFRYLRRTLNLTPDNQKIFIKLNIKSVHIRKIVTKDTSDDFFIPESLGKAPQKRLKTNIFKGLTHLHFSPLHGLDWTEDLKNSKNLKRFTCKPNNDHELELLLKYLKRINKNIEKIDFLTEDYKIQTSLKQHYKAIRKFTKLKVFHSNTRLTENYELAKQEFRNRNRYLSRITSLRDLDWNLPCSGNVPLQNIIHKQAVYSKITQLEIPLYDICDVFEPEQDILEDNSYIEAIINKILSRQSDIEMFERFSQEFLPSFPFQIFPNLKRLGLNALDMRFGYNPIPFSFVTKGFSKLCSLENLCLNLKSDAPQLEEIFKGILDLPQLSSFSLIIDSLTSLQWEILTKFLKKQKALVLFKFEISRLEGEETKILENFLASLSQKPKLQYLHLKSDSWPLSSLSRGFQRLVNSTHIKSFILRADDGGFSLPVTFQYPFQGLSELLLRNKWTLSELALDFPLLNEQKFHEELSKAISQLYQLKNLSLRFSVTSLVAVRVPQDQTKQRNPRLDVLLKPLKNLENLTLDFSEIGLVSLPNQKWRSASFKILPQLKSLKSFEFMIPDELSKAEAKTINGALDNLKHLNYLNYEYVPGWDDGLIMDDDYYINRAENHPFGKVMEKVRKIRAQQDLRINFSF